MILRKFIIYAAIALAIATAWLVFRQQATILRLTSELATARQSATALVTAQDRKIIESFELGRAQKAAQEIHQKEVLDALEAENRAAAGHLADARRRVRQQLAEPARDPGGADVPGPDAKACDADNAYRTRVLEAARILADGVLEVGADADEAARKLNALIGIEAGPAR